jgi:hypothetical protein
MSDARVWKKYATVRALPLGFFGRRFETKPLFKGP